MRDAYIFCVKGDVYVNDEAKSSKCDRIAKFLKKHWKWVVSLGLIALALISLLIVFLVKKEVSASKPFIPHNITKH